METLKNEPLFELGQVVTTPGAIDLLTEYNRSSREFLARHLNGEWGDLSPEDIAENELSLREGFRLFSSYKLGEDEKLWIITEADRSSTCLLRPDEY